MVAAGAVFANPVRIRVLKYELLPNNQSPLEEMILKVKSQTTN